MREIKFRSWNKDQEMMESDKSMRDIAGLYEFIDEAKQERDIVLMQYTELKDKNGKEIYEGDICKVVDDIHNPTIGKIVFEEGCSSLEDAPNSHTCLFCFVRNCEVIGNIYENPELLSSLNEPKVQGGTE